MADDASASPVREAMEAVKDQAEVIGLKSAETAAAAAALVANTKPAPPSHIVMTSGNFVGAVGATGLVYFTVAMSKHLDGLPIKMTMKEYTAAASVYMRYVPTVVAAASLISYYGTAPLIMAATGVDRVTANGIALGSIGPLLAPLYARQEGGIVLTSLYKMNASEAVAKIIQTSTMRVFAPGTLFTFLRNSVSLGVGGMLIADGGDAITAATLPPDFVGNHPLAAKAIANTGAGCVAGAFSGIFEFMRISRVIAAGKDEKFSMRKHVPELLRQRSFSKFILLRSTHIGLFFTSFIFGGELVKRNAETIDDSWNSVLSAVGLGGDDADDGEE